MSSVTTHFEPGPNGTIRFRTRCEDDNGRPAAYAKTASAAALFRVNVSGKIGL